MGGTSAARDVASGVYFVRMRSGSFELHEENGSPSLILIRLRFELDGERRETDQPDPFLPVRGPFEAEASRTATVDIPGVLVILSIGIHRERIASPTQLPLYIASSP